MRFKNVKTLSFLPETKTRVILYNLLPFSIKEFTQKRSKWRFRKSIGHKISNLFWKKGGNPYLLPFSQKKYVQKCEFVLQNVIYTLFEVLYVLCLTLRLSYQIENFSLRILICILVSNKLNVLPTSFFFKKWQYNSTEYRLQ